jgi:two-component system, OmpR family, phosphate regulon sensor histidine kinase PhoR
MAEPGGSPDASASGDPGVATEVAALAARAAALPTDAPASDVRALLDDALVLARGLVRRAADEWALRHAAEEFVDALRGRAEEVASIEEARRAAAHRAEESLALLEQVFEATSAGLALGDEEVRFLKVNPAYRALLPHPELDPIGRTFGEVWGRGTLVPALLEVLATGAPLHVDGYETTFPDGTHHLFSFHVKRVQHRGRPALLGVVWETTALVLSRRAAEEAADIARHTAAELDAVLAAIPHGVVVYDAEGRIVRTNAAAEALMGYAPEQRRLPLAARLSQFGLIGPDGKPLPVERWPVTRALRGETSAGETFARAPRAPGARTTWITVSAAPIVDARGKRTGAVGALFDASREHELLEMREDLLRMVSHDLRTPLQAVLTHAHLIRRTPDLPVRIAERAEAIVRTSERMGGMLQDLVEMVMLESGHLPLARTPLDLASFVREVLERLGTSLTAHRLRFSAAEGVPRVDADPARLERVVVNLVSNAIKYSAPETAVELSVRPAGGGARLEVVDRGVGIAPEDLPRIFGRFYRVGGSRQPEGLGLGLYIARLVVEAHGGRISVDSAPGRGSRFVVDLPASSAAQAGAPAPSGSR